MTVDSESSRCIHGVNSLLAFDTFKTGERETEAVPVRMHVTRARASEPARACLPDNSLEMDGSRS